MRRSTAAVILISSIAGLVTAQADITGFSPTTFTLNGNAAALADGFPSITGSTLNLTLNDVEGGYATSAWFNTVQSVANWTANFTYLYGGGSGNPADGFALVFQNPNNANPLLALGAAGGGLGYGGIANSAALGFNIYNPNGRGTGFLTNGNSLSGFEGFGSVNVVNSTTPANPANPINFSLSYSVTSGILTQTLSEQNTTNTVTRRFVIGNIAPIFPAGTAYVGFTGGTGGEKATQTLSNFTFTSGNAPATADQSGFLVRQVFLNGPASTANAGGGTTAAQLENIEEAEALLNNAPGYAVLKGNANQLINTVNFEANGLAGADSFPAGPGDDFALSATGKVDLNLDGFDGDTGTFTLYVNSDDGFRLRLNGNVIGEFVGLTGNSNITIPNVALKDGDTLDLRFLERGGGEKVYLRINDASGALVGSPASGIGISQVPEPGSLSIAALAGLAVLAQRRRR
jgi:hypothetical protein